MFGCIFLLYFFGPQVCSASLVVLIWLIDYLIDKNYDKNKNSNADTWLTNLSHLLSENPIICSFLNVKICLFLLLDHTEYLWFYSVCENKQFEDATLGPQKLQWGFSDM